MMEINFITYLETICRRSISLNGPNTLLSLETFFCDPSIDIQQFAKLTDWWIKEKKLSYLISANILLHQIMLIQSNNSQVLSLSNEQGIPSSLNV